MDIATFNAPVSAKVSLLNNPSGRGIGLAKKTATDYVGLSNRAMICCDADSPHVF
jgi:hypothetical protein